MLLSSALKIKDIMLRNRIVMPPMATGKAEDGKPTEALIEYYRQRGKATGLIIVEHEYVSPEGMAHKGQLSMADDGVIPAYKALTDAVHESGAAIFAQLSHAGAHAQDTGLPTIAPSAVAFKPDMPIPTEMTKADIDRVVDCFARAAIRAKEAGFDGVEIHAAHGYLLNQFYSPMTNKRTDAYGVDDMDDRTRFAADVLKAVRAAVGEDFIVAIRFGASEYREGGSDPGDAPEAVKRFETAGADLIDLSGGLFGFMIPGNTTPGWFAPLGEAVRKTVSVPVLVTGGITTGAEAEALLQSGSADLVGVGRAMLKDAAWSEKALSSR